VGDRDSEVYAAYRQNVTRAGIASEFEKKRRTLVVRGRGGGPCVVLAPL
jgi:hypothetical protein